MQRRSMQYVEAEEIRAVKLTAADRREIMGGATRVADPFRGERSFSVGSRTDQELSRAEPFASKAVLKTGAVDEAALGLGYACHKGLKRSQPNQDSWFVARVDERYCLYGITDGHGKKGHDISQFVKEQLPKLIVQDARFGGTEMEQLCKDVFHKIQAMLALATDMSELDARRSGTTTTIAVHDKDEGRLWVAHVGDSEVCLIRRDSDDHVEALPLTREHKPELEDERARIEQAGGRVFFDGHCHRVSAVLSVGSCMNMSRSHGDLDLHTYAGVSAEPEIAEYVLDAQDCALLLCSDGVWTYMDCDEAAGLVMQYDRDHAMEAAERLAKAAWDRWSKESEIVDDITVLCLFLNSPGQ